VTDSLPVQFGLDEAGVKLVEGRPATRRFLTPPPRQQGAVGDVQVAPGRRQDQHAVPVDELWVDADRVTEACLAAHVLLGQVVDSVTWRRPSISKRVRLSGSVPSHPELPPDAPGLDGGLMPVPGQALDPDHGEVAAEAPEPLQEGDLGAGPRRRDRRGQAASAPEFIRTG
jgi:hypothetical protein